MRPKGKVLYFHLLSPFSPRLVSQVEEEVKKTHLPCEAAGGIRTWDFRVNSQMLSDTKCTIRLDELRYAHCELCATACMSYTVGWAACAWHWVCVKSTSSELQQCELYPGSQCNGWRQGEVFVLKIRVFQVPHQTDGSGDRSFALTVHCSGCEWTRHSLERNQVIHCTCRN